MNFEKIGVPVASESKARGRKPLTGTLSEQERAVLKYSETVPAGSRKNYLKAALGKASPREGIKANCYFCVGYEDLRNRIRDCSVFKCPLWHYRPYKEE